MTHHRPLASPQPTPRPAQATPRELAPTSRAEALLRAGVPLSLLIDLAGSDPHSAELYSLEYAS